MLGILGKKIGMTQVITENGARTPVTVIEAGPCYVLQVKTSKTDGYGAIQLGFDPKKAKKARKAEAGHVKKAKLKEPLRFIREMRLENTDEYKIGQSINIDVFHESDFVDITGTSIGKGFQGGVKRWGWAGGKSGHGSMHHRQVGSVSASSFPSRIFKGHHMPGRMGGVKKTIQNVEILGVDKEKNLLVVKGSIPGHKNSYIIIKEARKIPIQRKQDEKAKKEEKQNGPEKKGQKQKSPKEESAKQAK